MKQADIYRTGTFLDGDRLIFAAGIFYDVRRGAVRYVRARDQERLRRTYELTFRMARAREVPATATVRQTIRPRGRAGVADFLRFYHSQVSVG